MIYTFNTLGEFLDSIEDRKGELFISQILPFDTDHYHGGDTPSYYLNGAFCECDCDMDWYQAHTTSVTYLKWYFEHESDPKAIAFIEDDTYDLYAYGDAFDEDGNLIIEY